MSLHDRYNRGGESRLELLDRYLTHLGDRTGNYWHDRTGASRIVLTRSLYLFACWASIQHLVLSWDPVMLAIAGISLMSLFGMLRSRGGLVEQIQIEAMGLPRRTFVILRIVLLVNGLFALASALGYVAVMLETGDPLPSHSVETWLLGCALTALQVSDYISRTNPISPSGGLKYRR